MGGIVMNENIDLTKILDGCPKGTKFYNSIYGDVYFEGIEIKNNYPIRFSLCKDHYTNYSVTKKGTYCQSYDGECIFFPSKDQRNWSKFERFWDKPKVEKFDPKTLQPFDKVLDRRDTDCYWVPRLFGYMDHSNLMGIDGCIYSFVIPYNDETKHLVGTTNDCPEYYKWWEE